MKKLFLIVLFVFLCIESYGAKIKIELETAATKEDLETIAATYPNDGIEVMYIKAANKIKIKEKNSNEPNGMESWTVENKNTGKQGTVYYVKGDKKLCYIDSEYLLNESIKSITVKEVKIEKIK